jgi:uncharacterized RmlC-like cupin family protein
MPDPDRYHEDVVLLDPPRAEAAKQDIPVFFGVSGESSGAKVLSLNVTSFPPGGSSNAHMHDGFETAIHHLNGRVAIFYGEALEDHVVLEPGCFCLIPPNLPHKAFNLSRSEPAHSVTARNDPEEQESVVLTPKADDGSAAQRAATLIAD